MDSLKNILSRMESHQKANTQSQTTTHKPSVDCELCNDSELVVEWDEETKDWLAKPCSCKESKTLKRMLRNSGLSPEQQKLALVDYQVTQRTQPMYAIVKQYLELFPEIYQATYASKGLALMGTVGVGKTMLASIIANELLKRKIPVIFIPTPDLMAELRAAQFSEDPQELDDKIYKLTSASVVILDDIAKEKSTEWVQTQYFRIVDGRYRKSLTTIFTSNLNFDQIGDKLGDAVVSRLYELTRGRQVFISADDFRINGKRPITAQPMTPEYAETFILNK